MKRRLLLSSCLSSSLVTGTRGFALVDPPSVISQQRNTGDYRDDTLMDVRPKTPPSTALYSMSPPQQQHEPSSTELDTSPSSLIKDCITLFVYTVSCIALAVAVCWYHDYEVSHTKPQGLLRDQALYGLAYQQEDINGITYPAYNTVLENHRNVRIQMWNQPVETGMSRETAIQSIIQALESIHMLKKMANNYEWDKMQSTIRQPLFTTGLEEACTVLRKTAASTEARDEIGFDWGSCAWRHCGAQADAQESLAELYNLIGILEPFECLFCLDIVERSLHDILAVSNVATDIKIPRYVPYEARGQEGGDSALDMDFLQVLKGMRSQEY